MLENRIKSLKRKLQESRFRLSNMYKDFSEPLYDMIFVATKDVWRMSTNGKCIYFDPDWLKNLGEPEIDFILSHELMHIGLGHIERPAYYLGDRYHLAADIVANGHLRNLGWKYDKLSHIGKIRYETYVPQIDGATITSVEAIKYTPVDPSLFTVSKRRQLMIDSDEWWDRRDDMGESGTIVLTPDDENSDDLVYEGPTYGEKIRLYKEHFPYFHNEKEEKKFKPYKKEPNPDVKKAIINLRNQMNVAGNIKDISPREFEWRNADTKVLDWRSLLNAFVQEEICDYSFTPPDRRMSESEFFLPDYNVENWRIRDVYFMVDTSGSISNEMISLAYSEIYQALMQFDGKLTGVIGFFDTKVHKAREFNQIEDIVKLRPQGGGGTDYGCVFKFIKNTSRFKAPTSVVIITDGEGTFPNALKNSDIPVLWLMTKDKEAPFGKSVFVE